MATTNRPLGKLIVAAILVVPFAVYGAFVVLTAILRGVRRLNRFVRLLRPSLRCPAGHENLLRGRWSCSTCNAIYYGCVAVCEECGAGAAHFPCETCGAAVSLR